MITINLWGCCAFPLMLVCTAIVLFSLFSLRARIARKHQRLLRGAIIAYIIQTAICILAVGTVLAAQYR